MNDKLRNFALAVQSYLDGIESMVPRHKLTLIARNPNNVEEDIVFTADDLDEVIALINRRKHQEPAVRAGAIQ